MKKIACISFLVVAVQSFAAYTNGFYAGADVGLSYDFSKNQHYADDAITLAPPLVYAIDSNSLKQTQVPFGVYVGYDWVLNNKWVLKIEPFVRYEGGKKKNQGKDAGVENIYVNNENDRFILSRDWSFGITFKPGYLIREDFLCYGIFGAQLTRFYYNVESGTSGVLLDTAKPFYPGLILGLGLEKAFQKCRIGLEADCAFYGTRTLTTTSFSNPEDNYDKVLLKPRVATLRLKVTIPF